MEKSLEDILSDAFSDTAVLSFPEDEELDFERLDFKDDETILSHGNNNTAEQGEDITSLLQNSSTSCYQVEQDIFVAKNNNQACNSSSGEEYENNEAEIDGNFNYCSTQDNTGLIQSSVLSQDNVVDKEGTAPVLKPPLTDPFKDDQEELRAKNIQDVEVSERPEDCQSSEEDSGEDEDKIEPKARDFSDPLQCSSKGDEQVFAEGQDQAQKDKNQNSNMKEEEVSYFESIQRKEGGLMIQDDTSDEEDEAESAKTMFFQVEYTLEYPEISYDGVEELSDEVDKMEDFSGDEHQEAGESFAEYPSDFSSCEYVNDARQAQGCDFEMQSSRTAHSDLDATSEKGVEEVETNVMFLSNELEVDCRDENSAEDDKNEMTNEELCFKLPLQIWPEDVFSKYEETEIANADNIGTDEAEELESKCTDRHISRYGSVDDSFFFSDGPKVPAATKEGQMEEDDDDDEEEEKRREQERIQAFYRFYGDDGDKNEEERQTKVQFCTETLSQVIHYDTESSGRESLSCSSDEGEKDSDRDTEQTLGVVKTCLSLGQNEEDLSLAQEPLEDKDMAHKDLPHPPETAMTESINQSMCNSNSTCLSVLKLVLSLFLAVVMGLLMFWWASDAEDWSMFVL